MTFSRNETELWEQLKAAQVPDLNELEGEYAVDMLTHLPNLRRYHHRKVITRTDSGSTGCNILFKNCRWGYFTLETGTIAGPEPLEAVLINYDRDENSFTRRVRDYIRRVDDGLYLGRFNVVVRGRPRFIAYFSLEKMSRSVG